MIVGTTDVHIGREVWHLIENFEHFHKRFMKAYRARRLLFVRYAGRNCYINPQQVVMYQGQQKGQQ